MSIIVKPQGFSINRCLRSLPVPCLPRGLLLHQEEWVFFLFLKNNKIIPRPRSSVLLSQSKCQSGRDDTTRCPNQQLWKIGRTWNSTWEFLSICSIFLLTLFLLCSVLRDSAATKEPGTDSVFERLRGGCQYLTVIEIWFTNKFDKINHSIQGGHHRAAQAGSSLSGKIWKKERKDCLFICWFDLLDPLWVLMQAAYKQLSQKT